MTYDNNSAIQRRVLTNAERLCLRVSDKSVCDHFGDQLLARFAWRAITGSICETDHGQSPEWDHPRGAVVFWGNTTAPRVRETKS